MSKDLIILRGIPGSGKSTFAKLLCTKAICSADDYHIRNKQYVFNIDNMCVAHKWCQRKCERFMKKNIDKIIIDNTNTTQKEINVYINLAKQYNYNYHTIIVENRHNNNNIHNVPDQTLIKMKNRFDIKLI